MNKTKLKARIKELYDQGLSLNEVANALNLEGYRTPRGLEFTNISVSAIGSSLGVRKHSKKRKTKKRDKISSYVPTKPKRSAASDKLAMIEIFLSLDGIGSADKKLKHIESIINL